MLNVGVPLLTMLPCCSVHWAYYRGHDIRNDTMLYFLCSNVISSYNKTVTDYAFVRPAMSVTSYVFAIREKRRWIPEALPA